MDYYIYVYLDTRKPGSYVYGDTVFNFEPFYVGKGKGPRWKVHLSDAYIQNKASKANPHKTHKIQKIKTETGQDPLIIKLYEKLSPQEAEQKEIDTIAAIGRYNDHSGPLTNISKGGKGGCGPQSPETKAKISASNVGKVFTQSHLDALREGNATKRALWLLTSPSGEQMHIERLQDFCDANDLKYREMLKISMRTEANKHIHRAVRHKGWSCKKLD